jgi:hypothetical protein
MEELVHVERDYKELLQSALRDKRLRVARLAEFINDPATRNNPGYFANNRVRPLPTVSLTNGTNTDSLPQSPLTLTNRLVI